MNGTDAKTEQLKSEIKALKRMIEKDSTNQAFKLGYQTALSTIEGIIAAIWESEDGKNNNISGDSGCGGTY